MEEVEEDEVEDEAEVEEGAMEEEGLVEEEEVMGRVPMEWEVVRGGKPLALPILVFDPYRAIYPVFSH